MHRSTQLPCIVLMVLLAPGLAERVSSKFKNTLNDDSERTEHTQESKDEAVHVHGGLRVSGHTAFGDRTVVGVASDPDGKCSKVLEKIQAMASRVGDEDPGMAKESDLLMNDIKNGITGALVLDEVEEVVSTQGFLQTMSAGHSHEVITASDTNILLECEEGKKAPLEENTATNDGLNIVQGDMLEPPEDGNSLLEFQSAINNGSRWAGNLWSRGVVSWCFSPSISRRAKQSWHQAVEHVSRQVPCMTFTDVGSYSETSCSTAPSIIVTSSGSGCYSYVGNVFDRTSVPGLVATVQHNLFDRTMLLLKKKSQDLNLGRGCEFLGIAAHELGHALGMTHEQSRPDREKYVQIHWQNMEHGVEHNFEIERKAFTGTTYDAYSLMHYDAKAFSSNGYPTITAVDNEKVQLLIGQRQGFSELDVEQIAQMYGCEGHPELINKEKAIALVKRTGQLKLVIVHARHLPGLAVEASPDPYCNVYINGHKVAKTSVVKNNNDPDWPRTTSTFSVQYDGAYPLEFKVKDADSNPLTHGKILGRAILKPDYTIDNGAMHDLKLTSSEETASPTLRVFVGVLPDGLAGHAN